MMPDSPRNYALKLLGQRAYTVRDLNRKLAQKEFSPEEIEVELNRLIHSGLLDDEKYARSYARARLTGGGVSRRRIQQALARKGIKSEMSGAAFDHVVAEEAIDTEAQLGRVARKKLATLTGLDSHVVRRRMYGFLARRGFDLEDIRRVLAKIM